jgi:hypothetical protein
MFLFHRWQSGLLSLIRTQYISPSRKSRASAWLTTYQALGRLGRTNLNESKINFQDHRLVQLGVFRLGGDEDRDVRVGVSPECEKILVRFFALGRIADEGPSTGQT